MKKAATRLALLLILTSLLIPVLSFVPIPPVEAAEQTFFEDNFESYAVGTFPSSGGWELWYSGNGIDQQTIVDSVSCSPTKSLKLLGIDFWAGFAAKPFLTNSSMIGFEVAVSVEETNGQGRDNARVAFTTKLNDFVSCEYAPVTFQDSGVITSGGQVLQSYVADTWYKIKLVMDRSTDTYSVWVDGELKGENLTVTSTSGPISEYPSCEIEAFSVSQCYNSVTAYFDDVKVFTSYEPNPTLELTPKTGISTTTLVGSGFAPSSQISVTWDGIPIPTVPSQVITDGSGGFTCIVSVLNQTDGTYTIRAVDGAENEESATFTVTTAAQSKTTVIVPVDYPTIQEAINHAQEGDTIVVKDGTYYENVTVNKSLTIESQNGAENTIVCTLEPETGKHVFRIEADNVVIKGFTLSGITGWSNHGIYLREVENCVISDNICVNNSAGINLYNSHSNLIENNNLSNNQDGLYMHQSHNNSIIGNVASKSTAGTGICLGFSSYNKIVNNTANENRGAGIELMEHGTSNNLIAGNIFSSNRLKGIQLFAADNNRIVNNTILNNSKGIFLRGGSKNNVVASNTILGNSVGIFVGDPSNEYGNCNGSRIYLNVLDNSYNVFSYESSNFWNSTEKIAYTHENGDFIGYLGNYWSNYNGTDTNGDGVGDVPYFIDDDNQDDYPLMVPNSATPSFSYILTVDSLPSGVTFTADGTAFTAPWSETYNENTAVSLTMPEFYFYNGEKYTWIQWTDGKSDRQRTVTLNEDTSLIAVFAPEDTPLQISVLSPTNKTYSTVDIPLEISVNRFFYSTTYSLDGQANTTVVGNTTLLGMSQGTHSIVIYIEDSPGSISALETVYFTVASANGFSILSPENRTYNTTDIPVTYTKNETCYYLGYSLDGQLYTDKENVTLTALSEGAHQLMFYANYSGSVTGEFATVWFTVDTTPPNITEVTQAPADTNETTEGFMVNATVTDTVSDVKRVTLSYSDGNGTWVNVEMAKLEGNIWNGMIPPFPHGTTITYTVIAEDNAGNIVTTEELYEQPNQYETLPEFQSWILLPLSLIITSFVVVIKKKTKLIGFNKILQTLPRELKIRQ